MPKRTFRPVRLSVALAIGVPLGFLLTWPQALGAAMLPLVAQILAFRAALAVGLGVVALVCGVIAVSRRRWGLSAGLAIALATASVANGAVLIARGGGGSTTSGELTVLAWNTQGDAAAPQSIARLVLDTEADIVSLPETDAAAAAEVARLVADEGRRMQVDTVRGDSSIPTSVLIADELGPYRLDASAESTPGLPSGVWRPVDGDGPTVVAAHPMPPLPHTMGVWSAGLDWVADRCDGPDVIIAGDLNATVDHLADAGDGTLLARCRDAATAAGAGAVGTWPTFAPTWLTSPIDHVLVGPAWTVRGARVITSSDDHGSDHRPIVAVLDRR